MGLIKPKPARLTPSYSKQQFKITSKRSWMFLCTSVCTGQIRRISPMSSTHFK